MKMLRDEQNGLQILPITKKAENDSPLTVRRKIFKTFITGQGLADTTDGGADFLKESVCELKYFGKPEN